MCSKCDEKREARNAQKQPAKVKVVREMVYEGYDCYRLVDVLEVPFVVVKSAPVESRKFPR